MVMEGSLSEGHARTLLGLNDKKKQLELAKEVTEKNLSVRETERLVKQILEPAPVRVPAERKDQTAYDELTLKLRRSLGTKVSIRRTGDTKGQMVIDYYSVEELERIADRLSRE